MVYITFYHLPIPSSTVIHISSFSTLAKMVVGGSQCGAMVSKAHLLEYTAHEVPLPLFGLGYGGACTFRGAPLPRLGQA